jgi:CRP-like cAMP-binding protein
MGTTEQFMTTLVVSKPADGSRVVQFGDDSLLFGQPPEVLKGLLLKAIPTFNTLVLIDSKEKDGSLLNNIEFPLYFFLFMSNGLAEGKKLNLVGTPEDISRVFRLLRLTLLGPTEAELDKWATPGLLKREWLGASRYLALKDEHQNVRDVESFFNVIPLAGNEAKAGAFTIRHDGPDRYTVTAGTDSVNVDLNEDVQIFPPYQMQSDFIPRDLVKLGLEILGSASGFTASEPCTGLALCYNGTYILIDSIPYLDKHLYARGISKNSVSSIFLTHLHDDHCAMFPLLLMPHKVEVITTREIFEMAIEKLSCHLNWKADVIREYFQLIEVQPGEPMKYFGMEIMPHITVHSIPTIGATFTVNHKGVSKRMCIIGDNNGMSSIKEMHKLGIVSPDTYDNLRRIYSERYDLLVADGGAGAIHGDPADALNSDSDRVVFVHVEHLAHQFTTTFSLASSGKRYIVVDGDETIYASLMNQYLSTWLGEPFSDRWVRTILAEEEVRRYNKGDVIMVQEERSRGYVYLILTGYCDVVIFDGEDFQTIASLQAGEIIGEMAVVTGTHKRNASVVASSPVSVIAFSEENFNDFVVREGYRDRLLKRWKMRSVLRELPQFQELISTVLEKISAIAEDVRVTAGDVLNTDDDHWYIFYAGDGTSNGVTLGVGDEFGYRPFSRKNEGTLSAASECRLVRFPRESFANLLNGTPQLNYMLRKFRVESHDPGVDWLLGKVTTT